MSPPVPGPKAEAVDSCAYRQHDDRGIAVFCRKHGSSRLEAVVDHRPPQESGFGTSFYPFRKFGFVMDDSREGWEFWPHSRMCYLELPRDGEQTRAAHDG